MLKKSFNYDIIYLVDTSIFISKQFEFVETILKKRKQKRFRNSFLLAFFFHLIAFIILSLSYKNTGSEVAVNIRETVIHFADYKPMNQPQVEPNIKESFKNSESGQSDIKNALLPEKPDLFKRSDNLAWRDTVKKKFIKEEKKILEHRVISPPKSTTSASSKQNDISPGLSRFINGLIWIVKTHWQIPEDYYTQLQGMSAEVEFYIDANGNIAYQITRSSRSKVFDFYFQEALTRTLSNFPYNNEFFDYLNKGGKIFIEFKL